MSRTDIQNGISVDQIAAQELGTRCLSRVNAGEIPGSRARVIVSLRTYPEIGVRDPHHPLTHHRGNPEWIEKVTKVNLLLMELFAGFVKKLKETPDGDGTLLDHSLPVYGSGLSDGNKHTHDDLPVLVVGHGGDLCLGRHIVYPGDTTMTNLYLTLLDRMRVHTEQIGDSTGEVDHLVDV